MQQVALQRGTRLYKYCLLTALGSGQSPVWLASDGTTGKKVALKILDGSQGPVATRLWEAQIGARYRHRNLCEILYADTAQHNGDELVLIAQEYYSRGACVAELQGPLDQMPARSLHRLLIDVLAGLDHLHMQGCFHNDIKPANILLGEAGEFILSDYGIASVASPFRTDASFYWPHIAPEAVPLTGYQPSIQTDIYQLGLTAYRLLNGIGRVREDFMRLGEAEFQRQVQLGNIPDRSRFCPWVAPALRGIVFRAIKQNPADRYQSALLMRRDLERISIDRQWTWTPDERLECTASTCTYTIDICSSSGGKRVVNCKRTYHGSGKSVTVRSLALRCSTDREVERHKEKIYQWVLKQG